MQKNRQYECKSRSEKNKHSRDDCEQEVAHAGLRAKIMRLDTCPDTKLPSTSGKDEITQKIVGMNKQVLGNSNSREIKIDFPTPDSTSPLVSSRSGGKD